MGLLDEVSNARKSICVSDYVCFALKDRPTDVTNLGPQRGPTFSVGQAANVA